MNRFIITFAFISISFTAYAKEFYELRTYKLNSPEKAAAFDKMMAAAVPLLATTELKSIGVFKARGDKSGDKNWRYVLKSCSSLDAIAESSSALANEEFLEQHSEATGEDYWTCTWDVLTRHHRVPRRELFRSTRR